MKGDQMGTDPTNPSPRELPLSNQTRFRELRGGGPAPDPECEQARHGRAAPKGTTQRTLRFLMYRVLHHAAPAATGSTADGNGTGCSTLRSTSSRGPNALASPWAITSTW